MRQAAHQKINKVLEPYDPAPQQLDFHLSIAKYRALIGGVGSGKTRCGVEEILKWIQLFPGGLGVIGRLTAKSLENTTQRRFFECCPEELIEHWQGNKGHLWLKTSIPGVFSEILFMHLDDPGPLGSLDISWFWIDEAHEPEGDEVPETTFQMLMARLRHPVGPGRGFITTNPGGKDWVWKHFISPYHKGDLDFWGRTMPTTSNKKYLPPGYEEELRKNNPLTWVQRFLDVSFDAFEGQIFPEYDEREHTCLRDDMDLSPTWDYAPGFDFGVAAATACIYCCYDRKSDMLYVYDEQYEENAEVEQFAEGMRNRGFSWSWADPAVNYRGANKETPADLYAKHNIGLLAAKNDEMTFFKALQDRIKQKRVIVARDTCPNLNEQIKAAAWASATVEGKSGREQAKAGLKYPNHARDAFKYGMSGLGLWGIQPDAGVPHNKEDIDEDEDERDYKMKARRPRKCSR